MKKLNMPLVIGSVILIILITVMLFPQLFTNKSPYNTQNMIMSYDEEGQLKVEKAPYPPSGDHIMGSDDMGRDIFSYIIYGTRLTIILGFFIALGRFVISIPTALVAGLGSKALKAVIKVFRVLFSAVPAVLIGIIVLQLEFFTRLDSAGSTVAFIIVLSLVGWPKLGSLLMERVESINGMPFIRGEVAVGKSRLKIALENVVPHLAPELIVLYFMEIARALIMIMTLGIFNIFVGNLKFIASTDFGAYEFYNVSFEPEWASMLSTSRSFLGAAPWMVLFPAMAFFISVLGFNLFGEGLRTLMQKKDFKIIPAMRKIMTLDFVSLWRGSSKASRARVITCAVLILAALFVPDMAAKASYAMKPESGDTLYEQVVLGTEPSESTANMIAGRMSELGIEPLNEGSYFIDYEIEPSNVLTGHTCSISTGKGTVAPTVNEDYAFVEGGSFERKGEITDATREDLFNIEDYSKYEGRFVLIDKAYYNEKAIGYLLEDISSHADIAGVLLIARDNERVRSLYIKENDDIFVLLVSGETADILMEADTFMTVSAETRPIGRTGRNIIGILRPEEDTLDEAAIMIGMSYNYIDGDGQEVLRFNLNFMKRLCAQKNKRSIIFVFMDGTLSEEYNGVYSIAEDLPYTSYKVDAYIDLCGIEEPAFDDIEFSDAQAPFTRQYAWSLGHQLEKRFRENDIGINELDARRVGSEYYFTASPTLNAVFWDRGIGTIIAGAKEEGEKRHDIYGLGSILLEVINRNGY
jgi:peptide/nickel transport system permease protein